MIRIMVFVRIKFEFRMFWTQLTISFMQNLFDTNVSYEQNTVVNFFSPRANIYHKYQLNTHKNIWTNALYSTHIVALYATTKVPRLVHNTDRYANMMKRYSEFEHLNQLYPINIASLPIYLSSRPFHIYRRQPFPVKNL